MFYDASYFELSDEQYNRQFQARLKSERQAFLSHIHGNLSSFEREQYATLLFNRFLFLFFLQADGWLDHDSAYLFRRLQLSRYQSTTDHFYGHFMKTLFTQGFKKRLQSEKELALLGHLPAIHDDLFRPSLIEEFHPELFIPDEAFTRFFSFLGSYRWYLSEYPDLSCTRYAITPETLGSLFEQSVNQQHIGAYYTKNDVTSYITYNTILPLFYDLLACNDLVPQHPHPLLCQWQRLQADPDRYIYSPIKESRLLPGETELDYQARRKYYTTIRNTITSGAIKSIDDFITYNLNILRFMMDMLAQARQIEFIAYAYHLLQSISILDPTCGSGAFLLAALDLLFPLHEICLLRLRQLSGPSQEEDCNVNSPIRLDKLTILQDIISRNLYGVDIMEEAIEMCLMRFSLKLLSAIPPSDKDRDRKTAPLLAHHHLRVGNALACTCAQCSPPENAEPEKTSQTHCFCWHQAFPAISQQGGFDVIVGNPPYVEYIARTFPYALQNFKTLACANIYPCVVEQCRRLLSPNGRQGMILPLAAFSTRNMTPFLEHFHRWFPVTWLSFYHFRPSMLFSGEKVASIPTAIYLAKGSGQEQRFSTALQKWFQHERPYLLTGLSYCRVTIPPDAVNRHYYPKFGNEIENTIMSKVLLHCPVKTYLSKQSTSNTMYYRSAGGLYWKVFVNFPWPYHSTSNKQCTFEERYDRDIFVALFNSSLFWWYYTTTCDSFNLKDYMLFGFRFTYPEEGSVVQVLKARCGELMDDFRLHAQHLTRRSTASYTIYARKSKSIIDAIDQVLAEHYGLCKQELDFILNYDKKYRFDSSSFL